MDGVLGIGVEDAGEVRGDRRWRTVAEKRRIVEQTLLAGVSVASVAREHGINANQVFQWRRQYRAGSLSGGGFRATKLLPVVISEDDAAAPLEEIVSSSKASIHLEFPGRVLVTIEAGVDPALAGAVLERLAR